jgi:hypothetical protein
MTEPGGTENTLIRSVPCERCGARLLWTQNAWSENGTPGRAAYRCDNGHTIDPAETPQCPNCGVHDTGRLDTGEFKCRRCSATFTVPR